MSQAAIHQPCIDRINLEDVKFMLDAKEKLTVTTYATRQFTETTVSNTPNNHEARLPVD